MNGSRRYWDKPEFVSAVALFYAGFCCPLADDQIEVLYDRVPVAKVEPMNDKQYYVRGCTALLDAIGGAIHHIANVHKYAREEDRPEKTLFIITTDGMENSSHIYDYDKVKKMVEQEKEKYGWEFLFLGANIDSVKVAGKFGISADRAINYVCDEEGTALNYKVLSETVSAVRKSQEISTKYQKSKMPESGYMTNEEYSAFGIRNCQLVEFDI